jgi:hypothetical protein
MCASDAPPPPDLGPLIDLAKTSAEKSFKLADEQFQWAKEAYAADKTITDKVSSALLKSMEFSQANAEKDRARYEGVFQPVEDSFVNEAMNYDTDARRDLEMGRAQAGVAQQFNAARESATRELESYGINPSATRYAALDLGARTAEAAAKAAAGTNASLQVENTGRDLKRQAIDIGRGYPAQVNQSSQVGGGAGTSATGAAINQTASGAGTMGTAGSWTGAGTGALGTWGGAMNQNYANQVKAYEAEQSSGLGAILGMGLKIAGFSKGGAVPTELSPSRGAIPDDVPIAVTPGEFVVPREAVEWFGVKHMRQLVEKAKKERAENRGALPAGGTARPSAVPV